MSKIIQERLSIATARRGKLDTGAVVRLHYKNKAVKELSVRRGDLITIETPRGEVQRIVLLTPNLVSSDQVAMDYNTRLELGVGDNGLKAFTFTMKRAGILGLFRFVLKHPDPSIQLGAKAAVFLTGVAILASELLSWMHRL